MEFESPVDHQKKKPVIIEKTRWLWAFFIVLCEHKNTFLHIKIQYSFSKNLVALKEKSL